MKKIALLLFAIVPTLSYCQEGALDQTFGTNGTVLESGLYVLAGVSLQQDGKIISCGTTASNFYVARFNTNGQLDNSFGNSGISIVDFGGGQDQAYHVALQSDGKIVVVGGATINSKEDIALVRLNTDGTLDNSFGTGGKVTTNIQGAVRNIAFKVAIQADGKLVIIGTGGSDFFNKNIAIRYTANGSLDNSFGVGGMLLSFSFATAFTPAELHDVKVQNDGKILISGSSMNAPAIARLNANGSFDSSFNATARFVHSQTIFGGNNSLLALQSDGKIVLSYGSATTAELKLLRLTTSGTLDAGFGTSGISSVNIGNGNEYATAVTGLNNGKIIISGSTYFSSTATDFFVARLTNSGTLDPDFGSNGFTTTSVEPQDGDRASGMAIQTDGKVIVAGNRCTGSCRSVLLRYNNTGGATGIFEKSRNMRFSIYPNPVSETLQIKLSEVTPIRSVTILKLNGQKVKEENNVSSIDVRDLPKGLYLVQVTTDKDISTQKFIKQ